MSERAGKQRTVFALRGELHRYPHAARVFFAALDAGQWAEVVEETVKYLVFVEALKSVGVPALDESWDPPDEETLRELRRTVEAFRAIDPLLVARVPADRLAADYGAAMSLGAEDVNRAVARVRAHRAAAGVRAVPVDDL